MPMSPRLLRPIARSGDSDVRAFIAAVEFADQQPLEQAVKDAYRDFIVGCKTDGVWDAIKASCILMGARTLLGALVPLKGPAPTNNGPFVSGDYDRKTGLLSNGTTKYIDTNFNRLSVGQDDCHAAAFVSVAGTASFGRLIGCGDQNSGSGTGETRILRRDNTTDTVLSHGRGANTIVNTGGLINFAGVNRSQSASYSYRVNGVANTVSDVSQTRQNLNFHFFQGNPITGGLNARAVFYSFGETLDLALLDSRASALYTAIGAAIP
jgi:hypothetical protein